MSLGKYTPYLVVLALMGVTTVAIKSGSAVHGLEAPGVTLSLPERMGGWLGEDLYYCQRESCLQASLQSELSDAHLCPKCGAAMNLSWSLAERQLLPADTLLIKKFYRPPAGPGLLVSVVVSGAEQVSIHRPQICLTGQGYEIASERTIMVPLDQRAPLGVRMLDLFQRGRSADGQLVERASFYAYWFVSRHHETPSHGVRVSLSAWDRLIHGRAIRWAYVSVSGSRTSGSAEVERQVAEFIRQLHPLTIPGN
jgi:hypothetical protein